MPSPRSVKALRTFDSLELANAYIDGCQAGLNNAPYGCSHPDPVRVRYEQDPIDKKHRVYIQHGYFNSAGEMIFNPRDSLGGVK